MNDVMSLLTETAKSNPIGVIIVSFHKDGSSLHAAGVDHFKMSYAAHLIESLLMKMINRRHQILEMKGTKEELPNVLNFPQNKDKPQ